MRVLVVGAGIIGAALADRLTRPASGAAARLTVVEAEGPGAGTSGASYAWINANDPSDPDYHRFRTAAMSTWRDLAAGFGDPAWYRPSGNLTWAAGDAAKERLADRVARLSGLGYAAGLITSDRLRALEPHVAAPPGALAAHYPGEAHLHGGSAARALVRRARASGADLVTGRAVRLNTDGDRVTGVRLDDGRDLDADLTVCAAGRHSPALLATAGVALPLVDPSEPGSAAPCLVATTSPVHGALNGLVHAPGLSARPAENGGLVLEADDLDAGIDESASPALIWAVGGELLARARALVPSLTATIAEVRRCVRPLPVDGYPLIGFQRPGLYTAVTHSGITLAPHLAALIAQEIAGRPSRALAPYRPDRAAPHPEL
ncbi:Glycine/D-amino acid oxidase (deaminating) [Actinomadura glauciflava]|uniref:NAD(P)/FAD-dependent oxidoreductase n=1 Tax=Actinomadura luteofluorescens TaxID=46163 RepID=UPI002164A8EC|nr:FAD-dependent oxidoreductase [Actinomadura glauciflava]MCR3743030.1 Glycine/D-amino acid oxidase (deaminating) [Actinomadura glauciflava]